LADKILQKPEDFHPRDTLAIVEGLLTNDRIDPAREFANTIRIEEGLGENYRAEAFIAIAEYLSSRPEGEDAANVMLDQIQGDVEAVLNLSLRRRATVFGENRVENDARIENCNRTLDKITTTRLCMQAKRDPDAAWEAIRTTEFANTSSNHSPLEYAQAAIIRTIAQSDPLQAVMFVDAIHNPAVQSELYVEFAASVRQHRIMRTAKHMPGLANEVER
jgi:hypothetical protein